MQTKYYLSFEQVGIIRRIPLKEQDPDMQGILDAFIKAFRIANELGDEEEVTTPDLINSLNHIDDIYIDTVEIYEDGFEMIEQKVPLGDYRNASFQYRCFLQTRSYPRSKAIQKEETFLSELTNQSKGSQSNCLFLYVEPQLY